MQEIKKGILSTLIYSDIFDFPLKNSEIFKYFGGSKKISKLTLRNVLRQLVKSGTIGYLQDYYFLRSKQKLVLLRKKRRLESIKKLKIARSVASLLKHIPTVQFIGISGSLAVGNCDSRDDIDLFIIVKSNTLWITRFFVNVFLTVTYKKRLTTDFVSPNKICPNMYLAEDKLSIDNLRRNLFTAREIVQVKPLFDRSHIYSKFLSKNKWVNDFLPNINIPEKFESNNDPTKKIVKFLDRIFFILQVFYMSNKITSEEVKPGIARFHPNDAMIPVLSLYNARIKAFLRLDLNKLEYAQEPLDTPGY